MRVSLVPLFLVPSPAGYEGQKALGMRIGIARDGFESYPVYGERAFFFTVPRQRQADQQLIL